MLVLVLRLLHVTNGGLVQTDSLSDIHTDMQLYIVGYTGQMLFRKVLSELPTILTDNQWHKLCTSL